MKVAKEHQLRQETIQALTRLSAGSVQTREVIFDSKSTGGRVQWERALLLRLEKAGYIERSVIPGTRAPGFRVVKGKDLSDYLDNTKKLTGLIWPGKAVEMPAFAEEEPEDEAPTEPSEESEIDDSIPDDQFKAAALKILFGMNQEVAALRNIIEKQAAIIDRLAADLGVK